MRFPFRRRRRPPKQRPKLQLAGFTATELAAKVGINARTVRYYSAERLLPPATFRGPATRYLPEHLSYLAAVCHLQRTQRLSLSAIRLKLASLSAPEITRLAANLLPELASQPEPEPEPATAPPLNDTWQRVTVLPSIELHLHASASSASRALAREIVRRMHGERAGEP